MRASSMCDIPDSARIFDNQIVAWSNISYLKAIAVSTFSSSNDLKNLPLAGEIICFND